MSPISLLLVLSVALPSLCQRPFYAGRQPIGYPTTIRPHVQTRFKNEALPPQLNGDQEYAKRLDELPIDKQPFWYINRQQYADMMKNPQTYPQRPSGFNENANQG